MPIYEYRCPDCSHEFEEIQKMSDDPVRLCPSCGKENVSKLLSVLGAVPTEVLAESEPLSPPPDLRP